HTQTTGGFARVLRDALGGSAGQLRRQTRHAAQPDDELTRDHRRTPQRPSGPVRRHYFLDAVLAIAASQRIARIQLARRGRGRLSGIRRDVHGAKDAVADRTDAVRRHVRTPATADRVTTGRRELTTTLQSSILSIRLKETRAA